mgnify:CR=1 FL=1
MIIRPTLAALAVAAAFPSVTQAAEHEQPTVVVTATRQETRINEQLSDVTVLERADLDNAGQSTVAEILSRQPGLEYASNGGPGASSSVYMRGGANAKHTVVLIDGMRVGSASLGQFSWSRLPVSQIERIEILRGPASALYGSDAIGGVIQIFTRRGEGPTRANVEAGMGTFGTRSVSAGVAGGTADFNYSVQATTARPTASAAGSAPPTTRTGTASRTTVPAPTSPTSWPRDTRSASTCSRAKAPTATTAPAGRTTIATI